MIGTQNTRDRSLRLTLRHPTISAINLSLASTRSGERMRSPAAVSQPRPQHSPIAAASTGSDGGCIPRIGSPLGAPVLIGSISTRHPPGGSGRRRANSSSKRQIGRRRDDVEPRAAASLRAGAFGSMPIFSPASRSSRKKPPPQPKSISRSAHIWCEEGELFRMAPRWPGLCYQPQDCSPKTPTQYWPMAGAPSVPLVIGHSVI
jgi:hypothetical protein